VLKIRGATSQAGEMSEEYKIHLVTSEFWRTIVTNSSVLAT